MTCSAGWVPAEHGSSEAPASSRAIASAIWLRHALCVQTNATLKPEGWSDAQLMVADIAEKIAKAGAPRCCRRDSRIAVRVATGWFNKLLGTDLVLPSGNPTCEVSSGNEACLTTGCPYY